MGHDRISDSARWRTCVHEAGHVTLAIITRTPLYGATAYRHYSTASFYRQYGYTEFGPAHGVEDAVIRGAGGVAEYLFSDSSVRSIGRTCLDDGLDELSREVIDFCADALNAVENRVLRVAAVLRDSRGRVPCHVLAQAFEA